MYNGAALSGPREDNASSGLVVLLGDLDNRLIRQRARLVGSAERTVRRHRNTLGPFFK